MKKGIILYHKVDFDGVFSCCVSKMALEQKGEYEEIDTFGYTYGDPIPDPLEFLENYDTVIIVDISFPTDHMLMYKAASKDPEKTVIWIDHHITAINDSLNSGYSDIPGLRGIEFAACEYAWKFFFPNTIVPEIIQYNSAYDIWDKGRFNWSEVVVPIQFAQRAKYGVWLEAIWNDFRNLIYSNLEELDFLIESGTLISKYLERVWKSAVKNYSFEITVAGHLRGICIMSTEFSSNIFQSIWQEYDIMCVVNRRGQGAYSCSLYIDPSKYGSFSAGEYLKENYGGGGHKGAAGCLLNQEQFEKLTIECVI